MSDVFEAVQITEHVYWVGAIDWDIRNFHGYLTTRGTTYNAFLVMTEKITLIDTVKGPFFEELMARISSVIETPDQNKTRLQLYSPFSQRAVSLGFAFSPSVALALLLIWSIGRLIGLLLLNCELGSGGTGPESRVQC